MNSDKTAIVTGYGGIGYEVALALALHGDKVIVAGRDRAKGEAAVKKLLVAATRSRSGQIQHDREPAPHQSGQIQHDCESASHQSGQTQHDCEPTPHPDILFESLDLFDPDSIRSFAERISATHDRIDTILCIAGVMMPDRLKRSSAGVEQQFAVNYLGHYELVGRLMPLLLKSDDPRVVTVSSVANRPVKFDLAAATATRGYDASLSYALSKLCCLMYAVELSRREPSVKACCVHPGFAKTQLFSRSKGFTMRLLQGIFFVVPIIRQSARAAAQPALFAATSPDAVSGAFYGPLFTIAGPPRRALIPRRARNPRLREELWDLSEQLTGVRYEGKSI
ncbi:MAG: SDR family NAD(P)-dependent oxidoreductase [Clostridiales Family XIII bacterium]|nr:SDR family NAD(P)-dependent oxidoreductase [Clostridiales Family XIII bacterium]